MFGPAALVCTAWIAVSAIGLHGAPHASAPAEAAAARPDTAAALVERARQLMGTLCFAAADHPDSAVARRALDEALDTIAALEPVLSAWDPTSELSRLNAAGVASHRCSEPLFAALDSARAVAQATGGAFDPTIEPLVRAWDLRGTGRRPPAKERAAGARRVDWRALRLDRRVRAARFERPRMALDLGGIGKGFALDRAALRIAAHGVRRARLNFGGEILAIGPWSVAVADPADRLRPLLRLDVRDRAVSTSGQAERAVRVGNASLGHILDPRSGAPVPFAGSVTVVAETSTRADAYATALLVMGRERARAFARRHPEIGVLWMEPVSPDEPQSTADSLSAVRITRNDPVTTPPRVQAGRPAARVWTWNLSDISVEPGGDVLWMP